MAALFQPQHVNPLRHGPRHDDSYINWVIIGEGNGLVSNKSWQIVRCIGPSGTFFSNFRFTIQHLFQVNAFEMSSALNIAALLTLLSNWIL